MNTLYIETLMAIAGVVLLGSASPGPNFIIVSSNSLTSRSYGLWTALGVSTASLTWAFLGVSGIALLLNTFQWLHVLLSLLGGTYLIFMGYKTFISLTSGAISSTSESAHYTSKWKAFKSGYLVNMSNPKTIIFVSSFFIAIIPASAPTSLSYLAVLVAGMTSFLWYSTVAYMLSSNKAKQIYFKYSKSISVILGVLLIVLGANLLLNIKF